MKPSELKKLIEPMVRDLVKESVREMMLDSGLLTNIIAEVMKGVGTQVLVEQKQAQPRIVEQPTFGPSGLRKQEKDKLLETKRKLLDSVGKGAYGGIDIFEGIKETIPDERSSSAGNPMAELDPSDPGVDIESLFDSDRMKKMIEGMNNAESRYTKKVIKG